MDHKSIADVEKFIKMGWSVYNKFLLKRTEQNKEKADEVSAYIFG